MEVFQINEKLSGFTKRISTLEILIISTIFSSVILGYNLWYNPESIIFNDSPGLIGLVYLSMIIFGMWLISGSFILSSYLIKSYSKFMNS